MIIIGLLCFSTFSIFTPQAKAQTDLYSLPSGAKMYNGELDTETILLSISQSVVTASPSETVTLTTTYQVWSSGGPGIIKQAFFIVSWTPSWPPPTGYYIPLYNGQPGYYPGVTETKNFSITAPSTAGTYYLWFGSGAHYSMQDAVNQYVNPLTLPAHAKIILGSPPSADLSVSSPDIIFSDYNPPEGQTVTISATVHNLGEANVENVTVQFFEASTLISEQGISSISHHSHGTASIDWTFEGEGFHLIKVVLDPYDDVVEKDEENNEATRSILVGEIPHFGAIIINGSATPNETRTSCSVTVQGYAEYNTTYGAGEPVAGAEVTIGIVGWEQETTHTIKDGTYKACITAPYAPGNYTIVVTVTDYTFWESIEIRLVVTQETGVDLTLSHHDISFSPPDPIENQNVSITATIHNVGTDNATNILVAFYDDGKPIGNKTIDLIPGGGSEDAMIPWNAIPTRTHTITVVIDPENTTEELNENNNEASKNIHVYPLLPDLTPTNIDFSDSTPVVNQTITISANVLNIGGVKASNILVSFYDGNQSIGNTTIPWILGKGESRIVSMTYSFTVNGSHLINATIDIENSILEADDGNNWLSKNIYVHLPSTDLTLSASDITFSNSTPTIGDGVTVYATIHNIGEVDAYNVTVEFFDSDTRIALPITIPLIPAGGQEPEDVSWNATPVGWHRIKVIIDGSNTIPESNENNNIASRYIYVYPPPEEAADLYIYSEDIVFSNTNPDPGENVTIYTTVHNIGEAEAHNITVIFYIDDIQLGSPKTPPFIPAGGNETVSTKWVASQIGSHVVKVVVDTPIESNKNNNVATRAIIVGELHDVAVTNVVPSETRVYEGEIISINVTVKNEGTVSEIFNVTASYDGNVIQTQTNVTLNPDIEITLTFNWNTSEVPGNHRISAEASIVFGETDTSDNTFVNGIVEVITRIDIPIKGGENATIEGNVTITKAVVTKNTLHFDASGPSGSTGWINVTFPMINTTEIKVFINKEKLTPPPFPIITSNETHYFIYFEFNLSTHEIIILFGANIAITNVTPSKTVVGQNYTVFINVTVENQGDRTESFDVSVFYDDTIITLPDGKNHTTTTLSSGNSTTLTLTWNTTGVAKGNHTITAEATQLPDETDTTDNTHTDGWIIVAMVGDLTGPEGVPDGKCDMRDVYVVARACGSHPEHPLWNPNADITGPQGVPDEKVDMRDVFVVARNFGKTDP